MVGKTGRIHAVETDPVAEEKVTPTSLCGLILMSQGDWMYGVMLSGMTVEKMVELRRKVRIYPVGDRPWFTIEEFCEGLEHSDDIDCRTCRKQMGAAIKRYWKATKID